MTKAALTLALELFEQFGRDSRLKYEHQAIYKTIVSIKEALAQEALDRKAENARELGLDYEPENTLHWHALNYRTAPTQNAQAMFEALEKFVAQPEEEKLHPVHIGVDVTREGTAVTAFYRKPDAVMEMFYSQFHPLAQPEKTVCPFCSSEWVTAEQHDRKMDRLEQDPVALETVYETIIQWDEGGGKRSRRELARRIVSLYTTPPQRKPLTNEEIMNIAKVSCIGISPHEDTLNFAKVIEAVHGINEKNT